MRFKATFLSRADADGNLRTVGVLVLSPKELAFKALPQYNALAETVQADINSSLQKLPGETVFNYYVNEHGNGVTSDWSEPFDTEADSLEEAVNHLIDSLE